MNTPNTPRSEPRSVRTETFPHSFRVGQSVRLRSEFLQRFQKVAVYQIVGVLPPLGQFPQYRIRSEGEPYERVATEDKLEAAPAQADAKETQAAGVFSGS